jgi:hypothetical protein
VRGVSYSLAWGRYQKAPFFGALLAATHG